MTRSRAQPLLLDFAFEYGPSLALIRHVSSFSPAACVIAFDETSYRLQIRPDDAWPWHDVETVLRRASTCERDTP